MKTRSTFLLALLTLGTVAPALATTVFESAPAYDLFGAAFVRCTVVNASDIQSARVTVEGVDYAGTSLKTVADVDLAPHAAVRYEQPAGTASCRFTLKSGNRKEIRAAAFYGDDPSGDVQMVVPAK